MVRCGRDGFRAAGSASAGVGMDRDFRFNVNIDHLLGLTARL
jgi:hypothetical protein